MVIGPTGSGKTPLGNFLERKGWMGGRCCHFDFGQNLRLIAGGKPSALFSREETSFIRGILASGALLKDKDFPIAVKMLKAFIKRKRIKPDDFIVLNGLPRHKGQAEALAGIVDIKMLVNLVASPGTIIKRIKTNTGGDRKGRADDDLKSVAKKLRLFGRRTAPLIGHYRRQGAKIANIHIDVKTMPEDILNALKRKEKPS